MVGAMTLDAEANVDATATGSSMVDQDVDLGAAKLQRVDFAAAPGLLADGPLAAGATAGNQAGIGAAGDGAEAATKQDVPFIPDLASKESATVAGAAAGLGLLAALAAYNWGALKFFAGGLCVPLFSRIQSSRLLDNEVRNRVHDAVANNPGVTIKEIAALCSIGWGTAVYHLKRLETERLIVSERQRQFRRFFKNGGRIMNDSKSAFGELKSPTSHRIAETIRESPGTCQKEVCERVGISAPLAHKYLSRLEDAGLVSAQREWRTVKYFPTPKLQDLLEVAKPMEPAPVSVPMASPDAAVAATA